MLKSPGFAIARVLAVFAAVWVSTNQFRYFDCNKMRTTSFVSGIVTVLLAYTTFEVLYRTATSELSDASKVRQGLVVALGGIAIAGAAAFFTMLTHICP